MNLNAWHDSTARVMRELLAALFSQDVTLIRRCVKRVSARFCVTPDLIGEAAFVALCLFGLGLLWTGGRP